MHALTGPLDSMCCYLQNKQSAISCFISNNLINLVMENKTMRS